MEFTRVRIGNQTQHARQQAFTALIPLPEGLVTDSSQPSLRAVGALNGQDQPIHYVRQGPKAADGSWRMARIQFSADCPAGVAGARGYQFWSEREIPIEVGNGGPFPSDVPHPAVDLTKLRFEFVTQMSALSHDFASPANTATTTGPVRTWRIDPLQSRWRDLRSPWTERTAPAEQMPDTVGAGGRHLRGYRVNVRLLPEGEDGAGGGPQDVEEPSLWATLFFEIASGDLDGWGRATRFWVQMGNSLTTANADVRAPDHRQARHEIQPKLRIYSTDPVNDPIDVVIAGDAAFLPEPATPITGGIEFSLAPWDPFWSGTGSRNDQLNGHDTLHDGISRTYQGVVYWRGGAALTASETTTRAAILSGIQAGAPGHDCVQYAIPSNLKDYRTFGAFGRVLDPAEDGWSIEDLRDQTADRAREFYDRYTNSESGGAPARDPWQEFHLSTGNYTNAGAARPGFGAITFMAWAMSGHPDVRALWLCASQESHRWHHFRKIDGSHWRWDEFRTAGTPSSIDSSCVFTDGRPFWSSNFDYAYPTTSDYPSWYLFAGGWGPVRRSRRFDAGGRSVSTPHGINFDGLKGYDFQHFVQNAWVAFTHLTGDRWCLDSELIDQVNLTVCSRPNLVSPTAKIFSWSADGTGVPRAEGRWQRAFAHVHNLTTRDEDIEVGFERYSYRSGLLKFWGTNTAPGGIDFGNWNNDLNTELPEITKDNPRYFQNGQLGSGNFPFQECGTSNAAWPNINPRSWSVWHVGILCQSLYGWYLMAGLDPNTSRGAQARADIEYMLSRMTKGGLTKGFERVNGEWWGYYAVPNDGTVGVRGAAPPESTWAVRYTPSVCSNGSTNPTGIFFGPRQNNTEKHPWFYRSGRNLATKWSVGIPVLAHIFNPGDAEVEARQQALLVDNPIYPDAATRRATLFSDNEPWQDFWAIIPDPFTWPKTTTPPGPIVINESGTATVIVETSSAERPIYNVTDTATIEIATSSDEQQFDAVTNVTSTATINVVTVSDEELVAAPVQNFESTATVVVEGISNERQVFSQSSAVNVLVTTRSLERVEENPDPVTAQGDSNQTLEQALGPGLRRSRRARIIETGREFKRLIPGSSTGSGRAPRQDDENPYRPDGR